MGEDLPCYCALGPPGQVSASGFYYTGDEEEVSSLEFF